MISRENGCSRSEEPIRLVPVARMLGYGVEGMPANVKMGGDRQSSEDVLTALPCGFFKT
jgi:hypothetical protein